MPAQAEPQENKTTEKKSFRKEKIIAIFLILIPVVSIASVLYFANREKLILEPPAATVVENQKPDKIIGLVGEEKIFQRDLDIEKAYFPSAATPEIIKTLEKKIANDSIILQGAKEDKFIKLDAAVFNSLNKDYKKRTNLVTRAKKLIEQREDGISGEVLSIWFMNVQPGTVGYQKGKEIASAKIKKLWQDVKSKKITVRQAGQMIQNDKELEGVDKQYKTNAYFSFKVNKGEKITFSPEFDKILWGLKKKQVSNVFLAKDKDSLGQMIPAVYMLGQIKEATTSGKIGTFEDWFNQKAKKYAVKYY